MSVLSSVPPSSPETSASPPRWARSLDVLCLILVLLAVVIAESGGFRMRVGGIRIALTSAYRLLAFAAVLAVVRHILSPRAPIYRDLPARLRVAWQAAPARSAWPALVSTRFAILFVGFLAVVMMGYRGDRPPLRLSENEVVNLQVRWDMAWYFGIAVDGYRYGSTRATDQQNIVFFPAFPMLMRVAGRLLGGASTSFILGGTLVALGAFFWALTYLFRLARDLLSDEDAAATAVWMIAAYPFALFFGAIYTESIFLLGAVGAFYHFRRRELVKAAGWGLLVGLTRPNGCFLSIPLAMMAVAPWLPAWLVGGGPRAVEREPSKKNLRSLIPALIAAAAPGVGVLIYSAYIWHLTGNPLAWAAGHAAWGREYRGLGVLLTDRYRYISIAGLYGYSSQLPADLLNGLGAIFVLAAAWPVWRRLGAAYAVFILINILPPMAAGGLLSVGRFSSVLFPAFIWFASVVPVRHRAGWLGAFMAVQAFNAALFYTWHELF
jgi:hypothetical protein